MSFTYIPLVEGKFQDEVGKESDGDKRGPRRNRDVNGQKMG